MVGESKNGDTLREIGCRYKVTLGNETRDGLVLTSLDREKREG